MVDPDGTFTYTPDADFARIGSDTFTIATIPVGDLPFRVAVHPDGAHVYVTNIEGDTVSVIRTATNTVIATVTVGDAPIDVAVSPDGNRAYVANFNDNTVSVIAL